MKVRLHLIFEQCNQVISDFELSKTDLKKLGLFGAIQNKTKHLNPKKILIL